MMRGRDCRGLGIAINELKSRTLSTTHYSAYVHILTEPYYHFVIGYEFESIHNSLPMYSKIFHLSHALFVHHSLTHSPTHLSHRDINTVTVLHSPAQCSEFKSGLYPCILLEHGDGGMKEILCSGSASAIIVPPPIESNKESSLGPTIFRPSSSHIHEASTTPWS